MEHDPQQWEWCPIDVDGEPLRDDPEEPQTYACTAIGYALRDCEGAVSIGEICTGEGREADEKLARFIIEQNKALRRIEDMADGVDAQISDVARTAATL